MSVTLPAELWDHALSLLSPYDLQPAALALTCALEGSAHVSRALLWRHLVVKKEGGALKAIGMLREAGEGMAQAVRTARIEVWRDDPQLLVNLLLSLTSPRSISLAVGPTVAPDHLNDLLSPESLTSSRRWQHLEQLSFRFNPYVSERTYYRFMSGLYFDAGVEALCRLPPSSAPRFKRLAFAQDLPPTHGAVRTETLAFGLHNLGLDDQLDKIQLNKIVVPTSGRYGKRTLKTEKMEFAQPIVFHQFGCLTSLAQSPLGGQLESLVFRLPRRNLLPALTDLPVSPFHSPPFPSLKHLDLSTTHILDDARLGIFLRMYPALESLTIDRVSGLISKDATEEPNAVATMRWLGKSLSSISLSRALEAERAWRRIVKERPADAPRPASTSSPLSPAPPPVRELVVLPPPLRLLSLGAGLHDVSPRVAAMWEKAFFEGYRDGIKRTAEKLEDGLEKWERWNGQGKLADGTRRLVTFADGLPELLLPVGEGSPEKEEEEEDADPTFSRFASFRRLVPVSPHQGREIHSTLLSHPASFSFCTTPDCSDRPGVPHLSFASTEEGGGRKEDVGERREKEKNAWEEEARDERERVERGGHKPGCAHLRAREEWSLEQYA